MFQCDVAQINEMLKELPGPLHEATVLTLINHAAWGLVALTMNLSFAVFLQRTAAGLLKARFLRHLAISFYLSAANVLVTIFYQLLIPMLALVICQAQPDKQKANLAFSQTWAYAGSARGIAATIISLLSTVYLFMTWELLKQYPKSEGVRRSVYTTLAAFFGGGVLVSLINILTVYEKVGGHLWLVVYAIDVGSSTVALLLIGWQLRKKLGRRIPPDRSVLKAIVPGATFLTYAIWGLGQLPHEWLKDSSIWYSALLFAASLSAVIMTIILCSFALEERRKYRSKKKKATESPDDEEATESRDEDEGTKGRDEKKPTKSRDE